MAGGFQREATRAAILFGFHLCRHAAGRITMATHSDDGGQMRDDDQRYDEHKDRQFDRAWSEVLQRRLAALGIDSEPCGDRAVMLDDGMVLSATDTYMGPSFMLRIDPRRTVTHNTIERVLERGGLL